MTLVVSCGVILLVIGLGHSCFRSPSPAYSDIERLERLIHEHNEEVNDVKVKLSQSTTNVDNLHKLAKDIQTQALPTASDIDDMQIVIEQSSTSLRSFESRIAKQTDEIESLADKQEGLRDELGSAIAALKSQLEIAERTFQENTKSFNHTEEKVVRLHEELQSVRDDLKRIRIEIAALVISLEQNDSNINKLVRKVYLGSSEETFPEEGSWSRSFLILAVGEIILFLLVLRPHVPTIKNIVTSYQKDHGNIWKDARHRPLHDGVCCIGFCADTQRSGVTLVESILNETGELNGTVVKTHRVEKRPDIRNLPDMQIAIVCIDYNEITFRQREDVRGTDRSRSTVEAAVKMGADVMVIYINDFLSDKLSDQQLFRNTDDDVMMLPVIRDLKKDGRFLSVYKELSAHQRMHCKQFLLKVMKKIR